MKLWKDSTWTDNNSIPPKTVDSPTFNKSNSVTEYTMSFPNSASSSLPNSASNSTGQQSSNLPHASTYALNQSSSHSTSSTPPTSNSIPNRSSTSNQNQFPYIQPHPFTTSNNDMQPIQQQQPQPQAQAQAQPALHSLDPLQPNPQQSQQAQQNTFVSSQPYQLPQMSVPVYPTMNNIPPTDQWDQFNQFQSSNNTGFSQGQQPFSYQQNQTKYAPQVPPQLPGGPGIIANSLPLNQQSSIPLPQGRRSSTSSSSSRGSRSRKSSIKATNDLPGKILGAKPVTKRSRMGCLTCRQRKKRCCETRPKCTECNRLGLTCTWPKPGTEHKNKPKDVKNEENMIDHEIYGKIKVLRGIVEYKSK